MKKTEIITLLSNECVFFQKLPQNLKKKFIHSVLQLLKSNKINTISDGLQDQALKVKCAAVCAQLFFASTDSRKTRIFRSVDLTNDESPDFVNDRLNRFIIPVRVNTNNFWQTALYDVVYGYYHCYLKHEETLSHFADHVGKVEMLMLDRFEFRKTFNSDQSISRTQNNSLSMFASICEQFFNHPSKLSEKDSELFDALTHLWSFNPLTSKLIRENQKITKQGSNRGRSRNSNQLHWIYQYTIISVFAGSLILLTMLEETVIHPWMILLLIMVFSLNGFIFMSVFKKFKIPFFKIPYLFFSVFGLGVNSVVLLLILNMTGIKNNTVKTLIFPYSVEKIANMRFPETGNNEYDVKLDLKPGMQKKVTFSVPKGTSPKFFIIELQKGLLGFYIIKNKDVKSE